MEARKINFRFSLIFPLILISVLSVPKLLAIWNSNVNEVSARTHNLPVWDYVNLWSGGKMIEQSRTREIFSQEKFSGWEQAKFGRDLEQHEWSYPPTLFLLAKPLSQLPLGLSFAVFVAGSILLLALVMLSIGASPFRTLLAITSPALIINFLYGQNGALMAALLIGGLGLAPKRPVISGVFLGALCLKPHIGILAPFCLLSSRNWKALLSAIVFGGLLIGMSGILFGWESWELFFSETRPMMQKILEAEWGHRYHMIAVTVFHLIRSLGGNLLVSYFVQGISTLISIGLVWRLWKNPEVSHRFRVAMAVFLTYLSTPYAWTYDFVSVCAIIAWITPLEFQRRSAIFLFVVWAMPLISDVIVYFLKIPTASIFLALLTITIYQEHRAPIKNNGHLVD